MYGYENIKDPISRVVHQEDSREVLLDTDVYDNSVLMELQKSKQRGRPKMSDEEKRYTTLCRVLEKLKKEIN